MTDTTLLGNLESWLTREGWQQVAEGPAGWMWTAPDESRVGLPRGIAEDPVAFQGVVDRLANHHRLESADLGRTLRNWANDITYVRAANDFVISNTIPLQAGAVILEATRIMYRSAATAAVRVRPQIAGAYSRVGNELADSVRMGQTIEGSYIIPILVPVGEKRSAETENAEQSGLFSGPGAERIKEIESPERRMSRTFAEAMSAVSDLVVRPGRMPKSDEIYELINRGVTREFVSSIVRVLEERAVASIDTRFEWAPSQGAPSGVRAHIELPSAAVQPLADTAKKLARTKMPKAETFTGPVVMVAQEPDERIVHFAIRTVRNGRDCRIESETVKASLEEVTEWMRRQTTVTLQGNVERVGSVLKIVAGASVSPAHLFEVE